MVQPLWETIQRFYKKLKIELPHDPLFLLLGKYPKDMKIRHPRDICTPRFTEAFITIAQIQKRPRCPLTDE